jgi:hypothetical protein
MDLVICNDRGVGSVLNSQNVNKYITLCFYVFSYMVTLAVSTVSVVREFM